MAIVSHDQAHIVVGEIVGVGVVEDIGCIPENGLERSDGQASHVCIIGLVGEEGNVLGDETQKIVSDTEIVVEIRIVLQFIGFGESVNGIAKGRKETLGGLDRVAALGQRLVCNGDHGSREKCLQLLDLDHDIRKGDPERLQRHRIESVPEHQKVVIGEE